MKQCPVNNYDTEFRGVQISFLGGSKPNQDPINNVFGQKNFFGEKKIGPPGPPDRKNFRTRPGRARGGPKGGQNRSAGVSKTVGHPQK